MRLPMRMAIATSLALIVLTASVGAVVKNYAWKAALMMRMGNRCISLLPTRLPMIAVGISRSASTNGSNRPTCSVSQVL